MSRITFFLFSAVFIILASCKDSDPLTSVVNEDPFLKETATNPAYEVQIIYTQIDRDETQQPKFTSYSYALDSTRYFYPASTVKFPTSLAAVERINEFKYPQVTISTRMVNRAGSQGQTSVMYDSSASNYEPSIGHYIKKIMLVSDNDAFNRLYEFLGQDPLNESLREKGYDDVRIIHRLSLPRTVEQNRRTNPIEFYENEEMILQQPEVRSSGKFLINYEIPMGEGYISEDSLIREPMNFQHKNFFPLDEQQRMIRSLVFPKSGEPFDISDRTRKFILKYMGLLPRESDVRAYADDSTYYDAYSKFLLYGSEPGRKSTSVRIFNKIGLAYGYCIDNAYIVDFDNNIEFFLSAVIHTNENRIFNDGNYEYEEIAFPFMKILGQRILDYERNRERQNEPDLQPLKELFN